MQLQPHTLPQSDRRRSGSQLAVKYHFRRWTKKGLLARRTDALRRWVRVKAGRKTSPSMALIDSQSVKTSHIGSARGFDGGKHVKGRKRHIVVDTLGLLPAVLVHPAYESDGQKATHVLKRLVGKVTLLRVIFAYHG